MKTGSFFRPAIRPFVSRSSPLWAFDGVASAGGSLTFTNDLADGAGTPVAITTTIADPQAWQRGRSTLSLAGTYDLTGGDPSRMMWRVGSGPWVALTGETIGAGSWAGTLAIPASYLAQGELQVKPLNGETVTPATAPNITVTDVYVVNGQSNADGYATNNQTYAGTFTWLVAVNGGAFVSKTADPTWNSNGSVWPAFAELLDADGIPPSFVSGATLDGTGYETGDWNPGDLIYSQAVSRLNSALDLTGGCAAEIWWQAEADSSLDSTEAAYFAASVARRDGFDTEITKFGPSVPTYIFQLGEHGGAGINKIRAALKRLRAGEDARFRAGPNLLIEDWGDGTHAGTVQGNVDASEAEAQLDRIASQLFRAVNSGADCPLITGAETVVGEFAKLRVTFDLAMENHTSTAGWTVTDGGGSVQVTGAAQGADATEVVLTCIRDLYGLVTIDFGLGGAAQAPVEDVDTVLREATAKDGVKLSPEYHEALSAGTGLGAAPANLVLNGGFDVDLSGWSQTGTTWQWVSGGAAECDVARGGAGALFLKQSVAGLTAGETYEFSFDITARTAGSVNFRIIGDTTITSSNVLTVETHKGTLVCPENPVEVSMWGNSAAVLTIDNVTLVLAP